MVFSFSSGTELLNFLKGNTFLFLIIKLLLFHEKLVGCLVWLVGGGLGVLFSWSLVKLVG